MAVSENYVVNIQKSGCVYINVLILKNAVSISYVYIVHDCINLGRFYEDLG